MEKNYCFLRANANHLPEGQSLECRPGWLLSVTKKRRGTPAILPYPSCCAWAISWSARAVKPVVAGSTMNVTLGRLCIVGVLGSTT
jgi:hypothetical protein